MFARAVDNAKPGMASQAPSVKSDLAKQLFPSSSPSTQNGSIANWVSSQNKTASSAGRANNASSSAANPLRPVSGNSQPSSHTYSFASEGFASICNNKDAFQDDNKWTKIPQGSREDSIEDIFVTPEDFSSDDENLELDYACPTSLPPQPDATPTSQISWSSSPLDHFHPPKPSRTIPSKRASPEDKPPLRPAPAKRFLPWSNTKKSASDQIQKPSAAAEHVDTSGTPVRKKTDLPWNATQSVLKERGRQFKSQSKKSEQDAHFSIDEIRTGTEDHVTQKTKASAISLSLEQQHVIDLVIQQKQSVFFTGPAGTGKSVLMRAIISELKKKWARDPERLSVTASTGLAACNIGGMTLHSFAGIGLGKEDVPTLVKKIRRNAKVKNKWLRTKTLIIDEISMVDGDLFDKLSQIARTIRNNGRPWGGIQLVITGDFFQLPPVPDGGKKEGKFAFDAATWSTSIDHTIGLTQVFRQRDPHFANMLNEMRLGKISEDTVRTFKGLSRSLTFEDGLEVTELFPTRQEVERSNDTRMKNLTGEPHRYDAQDSGDPAHRDKQLANVMAPKMMELKKGAQVMLIKNIDDTLVNGSLGKVVGFMNETMFEVWGMRESQTGIDDDGDEEARSRKKIKAFAREAEGNKDSKEYPVVRFTATDGTHRILLCAPEDWKVETATGEVQASRKQVPLILAWALSIHKAQGQTLERVKVDLGKVFEKGQAYVALSRAVSKQGLQVLRFDKSKVMAHARVIGFYNKLYSAELAIKTKKSPTTMLDFAHQGASSSNTREVPMTAGANVKRPSMAAYG